MGNLKIREGKNEVTRVFGKEPNFILLGLLRTCDSDYVIQSTLANVKIVCASTHWIVSPRNWWSCRVFCLLSSVNCI